MPRGFVLQCAGRLDLRLALTTGAQSIVPLEDIPPEPSHLPRLWATCKLDASFLSSANRTHDFLTPNPTCVAVCYALEPTFEEPNAKNNQTTTTLMSIG